MPTQSEVQTFNFNRCWCRNHATLQSSGSDCDNHSVNSAASIPEVGLNPTPFSAKSSLGVIRHAHKRIHAGREIAHFGRS